MGTSLERRTLDRQQVRRSDDDWLDYWVDGGKFHAACGARNLADALAAFVSWAD